MSQTHWANYYRSGALTTGPHGANGSYDGELASTWIELVDSLPSGASILDLGTGNGAVVAILAAHGRTLGREWIIHGIDLADINPVADVRDGARLFSGCHFHGGVRAEALPFLADEFDVVCGHYALEYTNCLVTLKEVARVLRPSACARFVVHHHQSVLISAANRSLPEALWLRDTACLYDKLRAVITMPGRQADPEAKASKVLKSAVEMVHGELVKAHETGGGRTYLVALQATDQILKLRAQSSNPQAALAAIAQAEEDLSSSILRLQDLLAVAHDSGRMNELMSMASEVGLESPGYRTLYHRQSQVVGWVIEFKNGA